MQRTSTNKNSPFFNSISQVVMSSISTIATPIQERNGGVIAGSEVLGLTYPWTKRVIIVPKLVCLVRNLKSIYGLERSLWLNLSKDSHIPNLTSPHNLTMRLAILLSAVFIGTTIATGTPVMDANEKPNKVRRVIIQTTCADCCPASGRREYCCDNFKGQPICNPCSANRVVRYFPQVSEGVGKSNCSFSGSPHASHGTHVHKVGVVGNEWWTFS